MKKIPLKGAHVASVGGWDGLRAAGWKGCDMSPLLEIPMRGFPFRMELLKNQICVAFRNYVFVKGDALMGISSRKHIAKVFYEKGQCGLPTFKARAHEPYDTIADGVQNMKANAHNNRMCLCLSEGTRL